MNGIILIIAIIISFAICMGALLAAVKEQMSFQILFGFAFIVLCITIIAVFLLLVRILLLFNPDVIIMNLRFIPADLPGCFN